MLIWGIDSPNCNQVERRVDAFSYNNKFSGRDGAVT